MDTIAQGFSYLLCDHTFGKGGWYELFGHRIDKGYGWVRLWGNLIYFQQATCFCSCFGKHTAFAHVSMFSANLPRSGGMEVRRGLFLTT